MPRCIFRLRYWMVLAVGLLCFSPGEASAQEKKGVYRFEYVQVHRGYNNFRQADKYQLLTPTKDEELKVRPDKLEIAATTYWYGHKVVLRVSGVPATVVEGQEVTLTGEAEATFEVKELATASEPYVGVDVGNYSRREEKTIAVSAKNPLKPGPYTLKVSKTSKARVGRDDSVFYTTTSGGKYARFQAMTRSTLSAQLILETTWFYKYDPEGRSDPHVAGQPDPKPRPHFNIVAAQGQNPPGNLPDHIRQRLEELRQAAKTNKWTFEVGHTKAADRPLILLAGTRLPAGIDLPKVANHQNTVGAQWLKADRVTRDAFNNKHPGVLPGLKVEPRVQASSFAQKSRFDWRDYNVVPAIRDQQTCGSCWSFAALGAFESNHKIRNNEALDLSEQQILDCANSGTCDGGWFQKVFEHLIQRGVGIEPAYPYKTAQGTCKTISSPYKAVSWGFVDPNGGMPGVAAMKEALCKHGPLAVSVNATEAFQHYTKGVFNEFAAGNTNHAVIIVGWDDSKGRSGAWAMRNSWSPNWGENGYMWIEYGCNNIGAHAAWVEAQSKHYAVMTLLANHYRVRSGEEVLAPIYLLNPTNVKNMNWTLAYQPGVAGLDQRVTQGNLPLTLFEVNPREAGLVRMGFAQTTPIDKTNGTVAVLRFRAAGAPGTRTPLTLAVSKINDPAGKELPIKLMHGSIEIVKDHIQIPKGSCTGREVLGIEDARCALQMSVGNRPKAANMDVDNDGDVTSRDAAIIIQRVLEQVRTGS